MKTLDLTQKSEQYKKDAVKWLSQHKQFPTLRDAILNTVVQSHSYTELGETSRRVTVTNKPVLQSILVNIDKGFDIKKGDRISIPICCGTSWGVFEVMGFVDGGMFTEMTIIVCKDSYWAPVSVHQTKEYINYAKNTHNK